ncbi:MAG: ParA family protein, partial [Armatimonadetes bacterium]|nr:ParA family protein [Armatimonadota bacterium]
MALHTRLFTWVNVEEVLYEVLDAPPETDGGGTSGGQPDSLLERGAAAGWPAWLVSVQVYWDGLTLGILPQTNSQAVQWLSRVFGGYYEPPVEGGGAAGGIRLESQRNQHRVLPVLLEWTDALPAARRLSPTLNRPGMLTPPPRRPTSPGPLPPGDPPIVAFHSFKGGVGRTVAAIGLCLALTRSGRKVLLLDADLEAPGITWLLQTLLPEPPIALADLLALVHGGADPEAAEAVGLAAERLENAFEDGIYFLPAFQHRRQFAGLSVRPEYLGAGNPDPFVLTRVLASLGRRLGVGAVVADLRAGLSETAAGLLLDPRVYRVLVTTLSTQSREGTLEVLRLLSRRSATPDEYEPVPQIVINQVGEGREFRLRWEETEEQFREVAEPFLRRKGDGEAGMNEIAAQDLLQMQTIAVPFAASLLLLQDGWRNAVAQIEAAAIPEALEGLRGWLPDPQPKRVEDPPDPPTARKKLQDTAHGYVFAELGQGRELLPTEALSNLAARHLTELPRVVVVGPKGSGKTYTFLQLAGLGTWGSFVRKVGGDRAAADRVGEAAFFPLLESPDLDPGVQARMVEARERVAARLGLGEPPRQRDLKECLSRALLEEGDLWRWVEIWLELIGKGLGLRGRGESGPSEFLGRLRAQGQSVVICLDGLESVFNELPSNRNQCMALEALLREVPGRLGEEVDRSVGLIVFVRRDLVVSAVKQNFAQLLGRFEPYALRWNREEALRLVYWTAERAGIVSATLQPEWNEAELVQRLEPVWGRKLGQANSREA